MYRITAYTITAFVVTAIVVHAYKADPALGIGALFVSYLLALPLVIVAGK